MKIAPLTPISSLKKDKRYAAISLHLLRLDFGALWAIFPTEHFPNPLLARIALMG